MKSVNNSISKFVRGVFALLLGSFSLMLSGCYGVDYTVMEYSPVFPIDLSYNSVKGKVVSASTENALEGAKIKAVHKVNGTDCVHNKVTTSTGQYSIVFDCLDSDNLDVSLFVTLDNFEDASQTVTFRTQYSEEKVADFKLNETI